MIFNTIAKFYFLFLLNLFFIFNPYSFSQTRDTLSQRERKDKDTKTIPLKEQLAQDSLEAHKSVLLDTLLFIENIHLFNKLTDKKLSYDDYLFGNAAGIYSQLSEFENVFYRDLGTPSNFSELVINGFGLRSISFSINGRSFLEPFTNTLNLLHYNFEEAQKLIMITSPKAFIYGTLNEPIALKFISKNFSYREPYSRIKYLEAPYDNLFFDGILNLFPIKKLNFEFGITKNSTKGRFRNSEYDTWKGRLKFTYLYSEKINVALSYRYSKVINQFNDGVNIFKIIPSQNQTLNDIMYNELQAPVVNSIANQTNIRNDIDLEFRAKVFSDTAYTSFINFYFSENERQFSNAETNFYYSKISGINLRQYINNDLFDIELISDIQKRFINSPLIRNENQNYFSISAVCQLNLIKYATPSVFAKYFIYDKLKGFNFGVDLTSQISENIDFYIGGSNFFYLILPDLKLYDINKTDYLNTFNINSKITYTSNLFDFSLEGFYYLQKHNNSATYNKYFPAVIDSSNMIFLTIPERQFIYGGNINFNLKIWKFTFSNKNSFIYKEANNGKDYKISDQPQFISNISLMYKDLLFNNSLEISTGLKFNFFTEFKGYTLSPKKIFFVTSKTIDSVQIDFSKYNIKSNFKLDFVLSGRIKKAATLYFVIENLTNNKYYLAPFYPVKDFGITFGVTWDFWN